MHDKRHFGGEMLNKSYFLLRKLYVIKNWTRLKMIFRNRKKKKTNFEIEQKAILRDFISHLLINNN